MEWSPISKPRDALQRAPNLADYPAAYRDVSWDQVRAQLDGLEPPRGRTGGNGCPGDRGVVESHLDLDRGVAS